MNEYDERWCQNLLDKLMQWPIAAPFLRPVDPVRDGAPTYYEEIKNPMDFSTIKEKFRKKSYKKATDFISDIKLLTDNAIQYNGTGSVIEFFCHDIMQFVNRKFSRKARDESDRWHKQLLSTSMKLQEHMKNTPASIKQ